MWILALNLLFSPDVLAGAPPSEIAPQEAAPLPASESEMDAAMAELQELRVRLAGLSHEAEDAEDLDRYALLMRHKATQEALDQVATEARDRWAQAVASGAPSEAEQAWRRVAVSLERSRELLALASAGQGPPAAALADAETADDWIIDLVWSGREDFSAAGLRTSPPSGETSVMSDSDFAQ